MGLNAPNSLNSAFFKKNPNSYVFFDAEGDKGLEIALFEGTLPIFELRLMVMYSAGLALAERGEVGILHQVFFISEAWMSVGNEEKKGAIRPKEDPDSKEVLIVSQTERQERRSGIRIYEISRTEDETISDLQEFEPPETGDDEVQSPLVDAFVAGYLMGIGGSHN